MLWHQRQLRWRNTICAVAPIQCRRELDRAFQECENEDGLALRFSNRKVSGALVVTATTALHSFIDTLILTNFRLRR